MNIILFDSTTGGVKKYRSWFLLVTANIIFIFLAINLFFVSNVIGQVNKVQFNSILQPYSQPDINKLLESYNQSNANGNVPTYNSVNMRLVGNWRKTPPELINIKGDTIFYRDNNYLTAADYSNSLEPQILSRLKLFEDFFEIEKNSIINEDLLIIQTKEDDIHIVDVSDVNYIELKSTISSIENPTHFQLGNGILYISTLTTSDADLYTFDLSDKSNPTLLGRYENDIEISNFTVINNTAFILKRKTGYFTVDFTDPGNPLPLSSYISNNPLIEGITRGKYAYLYSEDRNLEIVDYSDLNAPVKVNEIMTEGSLSKNIYLVNDVLYLMGTYSHYKYTITDPTDPIYIDKISFVPSYVKFSGDRAFFDNLPRGVGILNLKDFPYAELEPTPQHDYSYFSSYFGTYNDYIFSIFLGNIVNVYNKNDLSTPLNEVIFNGNISNMFIHENYLYQDRNSRIYRTDISDPLNFSSDEMIYRKTSPLNSRLYHNKDNMHFFERESYNVTNYSIKYFDLKDVERAPYTTTFEDITSSNAALFINDNYFFINSQNYYNVYNLISGDLVTPNFSSKLPTDVFHSSYFSNNNQIYGATPNSWISIFNVNKINEIEKVTQFFPRDYVKYAYFTILNTINNIVFDDNKMYLMYHNGFLAFDISNPNKPELDGYVLFDNFMTSFETQDGLILVSAGSMGNYIFESETTAETAENTELVQDFELHDNYPNPFNPVTFIKFSLEKSAHVKLDIFNSVGQKVRTLADTDYSEGLYYKTWDGTNDRGGKVASDIYFYRLIVDGKVSTKKMVLIK